MILAIDQGTTGTTCLVVDEELHVHRRGYAELPQHFPRPGWVEHDPEEIWQSVLAAAGEAGLDGVDTIAITNQRETTLLWDRVTGRPVAPAIVWQDRRTAARCRELDADLIRERTGLVPDPYFSATKLEWLLREHGRAGLAFGTVDTWLVWKLTERAAARDRSRRTRRAPCSRRCGRSTGTTSCLRSSASTGSCCRGSSGPTRRWGRASCSGHVRRFAGSPATSRRRSSDRGVTRRAKGRRRTGPAASCSCTRATTLRAPPPGLLKTAAADGYAHEGAVLVGGAALQWLRDGLGLLSGAAESEALAESVDSTDGVVFVPALTGLGSPWWDADARGLIAGITRGTTRAHLVRAALEAIAHQVADVVDALPDPPSVLRADGGATANAFLMQFQADLLGIPVEVAAERETTALGAAALAAGHGARVAVGAVYEPSLSRDAAVAHRLAWGTALNRSRT